MKTFYGICIGISFGLLPAYPAAAIIIFGLAAYASWGIK